MDTQGVAPVLDVSKLMLYLKEKCPKVFIQLIQSKVVEICPPQRALLF